MNTFLFSQVPIYLSSHIVYFTKVLYVDLVKKYCTIHEHTTLLKDIEGNKIIYSTVVKTPRWCLILSTPLFFSLFILLLYFPMFVLSNLILFIIFFFNYNYCNKTSKNVLVFMSLYLPLPTLNLNLKSSIETTLKYILQMFQNWIKNYSDITVRVMPC